MVGRPRKRKDGAASLSPETAAIIASIQAADDDDSGAASMALNVSTSFPRCCSCCAKLEIVSRKDFISARNAWSSMQFFEEI